MSYEIYVIVIKQKEPVHIANLSKILLQNEIENIGVKRYAEIWPIFSNTPGILYSLVTEINENYFSALKICDSDFDIIPEEACFKWISEDIKENLTPFIVDNKFYDEFVDIIYYLLESAPQKKILFQTRYQGGDEEVVLGVVKMKRFLDMLSQKQILFNICYIIEMD